jgi:carboxylate-amine ligase
MVCERITQHLPVLLALSCNSPCWENRVTGLQSSRSNHGRSADSGTADFDAQLERIYVAHQPSGRDRFINTIREIWWDVRPHHNFGTVEVRICDMPGSLPMSWR